jgi:D-3-phosphoglycerate dehydrogenase / 2-oxoglutarate reductase
VTATLWCTWSSVDRLRPVWFATRNRSAAHNTAEVARVRILIADALPPASIAAIEAGGASCEVRPSLTAADLPGALPGMDAVVVRSTPVAAEALDAGDRLRLVVRAGSGTNTIDRDAAAQRGIAVCNVPGRNSIAVAELTFALLLCLDRNVPDAVADLRAGRWDKARYSRARGLYGRRLGIVGLGEIGLAVAERGHAFGMQVHAVRKPGRDPASAARAEAAEVRFVDGLDELAARCDALSFHVPLSEETRGLVGHDLLAHCPDGAWVINTSRGEIVDDEALIAAMDTRGLRAGIDVFNGEPPQGTGTFVSPLAQHPSVYGTHHIGASTEQAQQAVADEVVRIIGAFAEGRILHAVNGITDPA